MIADSRSAECLGLRQARAIAIAQARGRSPGGAKDPIVEGPLGGRGT